MPIDFVRAVDRLDRCAVETGRRLAARLQQALSLHDLNRHELVAAQRDVTRLTRIGLVPGPTEYWKRSALPRAATMVDASMAAVVEEGQRLGEALDRFLLDLDEPPLAAWTAQSMEAAIPQEAGARAIGHFLDAVPSNRSIDALGSWWQRRLRRTAVVRSIPELISSGADAELIIGRTEMALLDRPPWSHGDRLLSAFELGHGEIRTQSELVAEGLAARVAKRGRRYLSPGRRVTIELP